jgi:hypothetical protein
MTSQGAKAKHEGKAILGFLVLFLAVNLATGARCPSVIEGEMTCTHPAAHTTAFRSKNPIVAAFTRASAITPINDARAMSFSGGSGADYDPLRLSVKADCRAYGDGLHDDTAAIQACLNRFTNGIASLATGTLYFPTGTYLISNYLYYMGMCPTPSAWSALEATAMAPGLSAPARVAPWPCSSRWA